MEIGSPSLVNMSLPGIDNRDESKVLKLKEIEELKSNPIMHKGLKTMIMFNKHLTQVEPLRLPEGVSPKDLSPYEIRDFHLKANPLMEQPKKLLRTTYLQGDS
jgi:hypothetical protein